MSTAVTRSPDEQGSLLVRVRRSMAIHAHRKVRGLLDGEYGSVFKGRSLDFADLREYIPGDDVKDIDWKASARSGHPLIRRYVAQRKHTVALVVDTGRGMAALNDLDTPKVDLALTAAGVLSWIAHKHGDRVCLVSGDADHSRYLPPASSQSHLERLLRQVRDTTSLDSGRSDLLVLLRRASLLKDRTIMVVICGDEELTEQVERSLRRLAVLHEILLLVVEDVPLADAELARHRVSDVDTGTALPGYLRRSKKLAEELAAQDQQRHVHRAAALERLGIASTCLTTEPEVIPALYQLLERHRRARRPR